MATLPTNVSASTRKRNPSLYGTEAVALKPHTTDAAFAPAKRIRQSDKPLMNLTEQKCQALLECRGVVGIMQQAITLRLGPPFKSYRPDLAYLGASGLVFVEAKGQHRFRRAGIAKVALAAKTYPQFRFELFEWDGKAWKESVLSS
jgi:hypothetical protein